MTNLYRFHLPSLSPGPAELPEDQAHHALHVLRLPNNTPVQLFDGQGHSATAQLHIVAKRARLTVGPVAFSPPPAVQLTLATAAPKSDRAEQLVEQASQLNAFAVQWLDTDRAVVKPKEASNKIEKLKRLAVESAKQCQRDHLLQILPMQNLPAILQAAQNQNAILLWLEPHAGLLPHQLLPQFAEKFSAATPENPLRLTALIGPEGGWSDRELALLASHPQTHRLKLTPTILRIETAAAAITTLITTR